MKKAKKESKVAATVTIKDAAKMTPKGRREIAAWLRGLAKHVIDHGKDYSPRFVARFYYR